MKQLITHNAARTAALLNRQFGHRVGDAFGILMYHRITPTAGLRVEPTWNVTPAQLRTQLAGLLDLGYTAWPLRKVLRYADEGLEMPSRVFVVTFDDGYANNLHHALPVLRELQVPATIFLATGYLDDPHPFPFDDWTETGSRDVDGLTWLPLTSDECRELAADELIELGAHTHWHADYADRPQAFRRDLERCLTVLNGFCIDAPTFSFPFGSYNRELLKVAHRVDVSCALTTSPRLAKPSQSPFGWGRFAAFEHDTPETLAAKLSGWYSLFAMLWDGLREMRRGGRFAAFTDAATANIHPTAGDTVTATDERSVSP